MYWCFKKIPFTVYTYVLAKVLQNGVKFIQNLTPAFNNHMRNLGNFRQAVENPKSWNLMGYYFCPKNTLYTENLSNIIFNYLCENSTNFLCHFWNYKSFFTTQLLCIFLTQTLHTFFKSSPSKCKFSDFPLLGLKFTKFSYHFSNKKSVFLKSLDLFSMSWEIILLHFFSWNFICYWQK